MAHCNACAQDVTPVIQIGTGTRVVCCPLCRRVVEPDQATVHGGNVPKQKRPRADTPEESKPSVAARPTPTTSATSDSAWGGDVIGAVRQRLAFCQEMIAELRSYEAEAEVLAKMIAVVDSRRDP